MPKLSDIGVDDVRDIISRLRNIRNVAESVRELSENMCSKYSSMERWIRETFVFVTHQEAEDMRKLLEKTRRYITSFDVPADKDFPDNLILLLETKIEALEKVNKDQPVHDPDPTAEA